jgi:hypothetical protein
LLGLANGPAGRAINAMVRKLAETARGRICRGAGRLGLALMLTEERRSVLERLAKIAAGGDGGKEGAKGAGGYAGKSASK